MGTTRHPSPASMPSGGPHIEEPDAFDPVQPDTMVIAAITNGIHKRWFMLRSSMTQALLRGSLCLLSCVSAACGALAPDSVFTPESPDSGTAAVPSLTNDAGAPGADAGYVQETFACGESLSDVCCEADHTCPKDWSSAVLCNSWDDRVSLYSTPCGGAVLVSYTDSFDVFLYDGSGRLYAILSGGNYAQVSCFGPSSVFLPASCQPFLTTGVGREACQGPAAAPSAPLPPQYCDTVDAGP
jgi:hypothetical protein